MNRIVQQVFDLALPLAAEQGIEIWDVTYTKEAGEWFLRVYIDKPDGVGITDDHLPVNEVAHIPCIDIIPYYPDCEQSSFGPTWHTVNDDMQHIDRNTLQAVGQTLVQLIYSE